MSTDSAQELLEDSALYAGASEGRDRKARRQLLEWLIDAGVDADALRERAADGRLATLPVELALRGEGHLTLSQLADESKLESKFLRAVVLALGHTNPRPRERRFTDEDLEMASALRRFLDAGMTRSDVLDVSRVIGQAVAQIAAVSREVFAERMMKRGDSEADVALRFAEVAKELAPLLGSVLGYELSVHLREQATREVITREELARGTISGTREVAVCFADLSDFTRLGESMPVELTGSIGTRMAALATEVAEPPVELVKTVGDGAMLVSREAQPLVGAASRLVERVEEEGEDFPRARAGIAYGEAVSRGGDWYGPAINRASRIVDVARPGSILVEEDVMKRADGGFSWSQRRLKKRLRGVEGRVKLYRLAGTEDE